MTEIENKVVALGCRLNIFEAELLKDQAKKAGLKNTIIVNTCTVTQEAHRQSMQTIRKLKRENPDSLIIVTGCGAEIDPSAFAQMNEVDKVIGNKDKFEVSALVSRDRIVKNDINSDNDSNNKDYILPEIKGFENKTRAFIQIQQGCDHRCTFCIIYKARGKSRSVEKNKIIAQIRQAVKFGHKDIVLTGVDISSWQRDALLREPSQIGKLCLDILKEIPELPRLRLSSLDPAVEDENILRLLENEERFMPHIHLSLQTMNNKVLANMGRRHTKESAIAWIEKIRKSRADVALGADIICGFPRESDEQYIETYESIEQLKIPFLHIFPYSERQGTVAMKMQAIAVADRKRRAKLLQHLGHNIKAEFFKSKVGKIEEVLIEGNNNAYTKDYCLVKINNSTPLEKKTIISVKIVGYNNQHLIAEYDV